MKLKLLFAPSVVLSAAALIWAAQPPQSEHPSPEELAAQNQRSAGQICRDEVASLRGAPAPSEIRSRNSVVRPATLEEYLGITVPFTAERDAERLASDPGFTGLRETQLELFERGSLVTYAMEVEALGFEPMECTIVELRQTRLRPQSPPLSVYLNGLNRSDRSAARIDALLDLAQLLARGTN